MKRGYLNVVAFSVVIITTLAIDMIIPSLTLIQGDMQATYSSVQLIVSVYIFIYAFSLLIVTDVAKRVGEKNSLIIALLVFTGGGALCAFSSNVPMLLLGRAMQALGAAFGPALTQAIIRSQNEGGALRARLADLATIAATVPIIAPVCGGYLAQLFGWRSTFVVLAASGAVGVAIVSGLLRLPPGSTVDTDKQTTHQLRELARQNSFKNGVLLISSTYSLIFVYISMSPVIFINHFGFTPSIFSVIFGSSVLFYLIGTQLSKFISTHKAEIVLSSLTCIGGVFIIMATIYAAQNQTMLITVMMIGIALFNIAAGYVLPLGQSLLLSGPPKLSTTASSFGLFVQNVTAAVLSAAFTAVAAATGWDILVFGLVMAATGTVQLSVARLVQRRKELMESELALSPMVERVRRTTTVHPDK